MVENAPPNPTPDNTTRVRQFEIPFGVDPRGQGFYWPSSDQKRSEVLSVKRNAPADFEAVYQGRPGAREGVIFLAKDLDAFFYPTLADGTAFPFTEFELALNSPYVRKFIERGQCVLQSWDTAFSTTLSSAWSVCVTALLIPCQKYHCGEDENQLGPCEFHYDVLILNVFRKRLDFGDLSAAFKTHYRMWTPFEVLLEKKASGFDIMSALKSAAIPITAVEPRESKRARAINSVGPKTAGSVQGWFRQHRVLTPTYAPWLEQWRTEMKDFSGADDTSSDQVDATVHLVTKAIILGSSMITLPTDYDRAEAPGYLLNDQLPIDPTTDPRRMFLSVLGELPNMVDDPYYGTCSRCIHEGVKFCKIQNRRMLAMDSCDQFADTAPTDVNALSEAFRMGRA